MRPFHRVPFGPFAILALLLTLPLATPASATPAGAQVPSSFTAPAPVVSAAAVATVDGGLVPTDVVPRHALRGASLGSASTVAIGALAPLNGHDSEGGYWQVVHGALVGGPLVGYASEHVLPRAALGTAVGAATVLAAGAGGAYDDGRGDAARRARWISTTALAANAAWELGRLHHHTEAAAPVPLAPRLPAGRVRTVTAVTTGGTVLTAGALGVWNGGAELALGAVTLGPLPGYVAMRRTGRGLAGLALRGGLLAGALASDNGGVTGLCAAASAASCVVDLVELGHEPGGGAASRVSLETAPLRTQRGATAAAMTLRF